MSPSASAAPWATVAAAGSLRFRLAPAVARGSSSRRCTPAVDEEGGHELDTGNSALSTKRSRCGGFTAGVLPAQQAPGTRRSRRAAPSAACAARIIMPASPGSSWPRTPGRQRAAPSKVRWHSRTSAAGAWKKAASDARNRSTTNRMTASSCMNRRWETAAATTCRWRDGRWPPTALSAEVSASPETRAARARVGSFRRRFSAARHSHSGRRRWWLSAHRWKPATSAANGAKTVVSSSTTARLAVHRCPRGPYTGLTRPASA